MLYLFSISMISIWKISRFPSKNNDIHFKDTIGYLAVFNSIVWLIRSTHLCIYPSSGVTFQQPMIFQKVMWWFALATGLKYAFYKWGFSLVKMTTNIFMPQIVLYFLLSTSIISFYLGVILTFSIQCGNNHILQSSLWRQKPPIMGCSMKVAVGWCIMIN